MDFDFDRFVGGAKALRQKTIARREAEAVEHTATSMLQRSADSLVGQVVALEYDDTVHLRGRKVQRFLSERWQIAIHESGAPQALVTGFGVDQLEGAYLEAVQIGRGGTIRIFIDGLSKLEVIDVANLQPQPG